MNEFETPSIEHELSRKTISVLIDLEERRASGKINQREFEIGLQTVFAVTSGLTCELEVDPFELITEMSRSVVRDSSFCDIRILRSGFDNKFVMLRHKKGEREAQIITGEIGNAVMKSATEDETAEEFIKRLNAGLANKLPNYTEMG